jgi:hypothetical protein
MSAYKNAPVTESDRRFSVELETATCEGYESIGEKTVFTAHYDGSIDGKEFKGSKLRGNDGLSACVTFCKVANGLGWTTNKKCGYHLHLDMSGESIESLRKICKAYLATQKVWQAMVRNTRKKNHYCAAIEWTNEQIDRIESTESFYNWAGGIDRYCFFNVAAYRKHGTFEIRLFNGTLDANKVTMWAAAHLYFVDRAKSLSAETTARLSTMSARDAFNVIMRDAPRDMRLWLESRVDGKTIE